MKNDVLSSALVGVFESIKAEYQRVDSLDHSVVLSAKSKIKATVESPGLYILQGDFEPLTYYVNSGPRRDFYIRVIDRRTGEVVSDSRFEPRMYTIRAGSTDSITLRPGPR